MTQETLSKRSELSPDTIRRLEQGSFSPSLWTLEKLSCGLDLRLSTFFESYETGFLSETREIIDLIVNRNPREQVMALHVLRAMFDQLDTIAAKAARGEDENSP